MTWTHSLLKIHSFSFFNLPIHETSWWDIQHRLYCEALMQQLNHPQLSHSKLKSALYQFSSKNNLEGKGHLNLLMIVFGFSLQRQIQTGQINQRNLVEVTHSVVWGNWPPSLRNHKDSHSSEQAQWEEIIASLWMMSHLSGIERDQLCHAYFKDLDICIT